jgi:RNA polymerase sigma-70 factor (ECF subfamily)
MYSPKLFGICLKYSRNYAEAQDNLQEGFLLLFDKIKQYSFKGSFEGWIKRLMINYVLQQYRNETFLNIVNEEIADDIEVVFDDDDITIEYLMLLIHELPNRYKLVFTLFVIDEYSHQEIAEMLGISIGTSKSNLSRAKMTLKQKIENRANKKSNHNFPKAK